MALLYLVVLFTLLGVLVTAGARMYGSTVTQRKLTDTKAALERDVQMLSAWSARNGRLPLTSPINEYATVFGTIPLDAWGKPFAYVYDETLANSSVSGFGGICGREHTGLTVKSCPDVACMTPSSTTADVAFVLLSGGDNYNNQTAATGGAATVNTYAGTVSVDGYAGDVNRVEYYDDMVRVVTLNELKTQAGCFGGAQGGLRIVNNELPNACKRVPYDGTSIFGDGGVPPLSYAVSGLPRGMRSSGGSIMGTASSASKGAYPVVVTLTDSAAVSVKRSYVLNLMSSCY